MKSSAAVEGDNSGGSGDGTTQTEERLVEKVTLHSPRTWLYRLDVLPFALFYAVGFSLCLHYGSPSSIGEKDHEYYLYIGLIGLPIGLSLHLLLFLLAQWSTFIRSLVGTLPTTSLEGSKVAHVTAAKNAGSDRLVSIERLPDHQFKMVKEGIEIFGKTFSIAQYYMSFQKIKFDYDYDCKTFVRMKYPTCAPLSQFLSWQGHGSKKQVQLSLFKWGYNEFDIPLPSFLDLYVTHLTAPFFVFQVICLFLWSLDDYWYYSVFTLLMLMFFEGMMCRQRQNSLTMLRNMRRPPIKIFVYRCKQWDETSSDELVPGDVISLTSSKGRGRRTAGNRKSDSNVAVEELVVPCDALLLEGSCVVNEAMLTGESVPQMKETPNGQENADVVVDLGNEGSAAAWKRNIVYSGTTLMLHTTSSGQSSSIPEAPDKGCLAIVLRTSFGTTQGALMRKILFATERVTGNSSETFYFIGVLVIFAIFAASAVLYHGLGDDKRNKFRLVLHCIMIITSVVPPELPMELSLAVTNSLAALGQSLVYCTEPFRISFAGKLDILCFDKTGTLTKDKMILKGVVAAQDLPFFPSATDAGDETPDNDSQPVTDIMEPSSVSDLAQVIMGACHNLMQPPSAGPQASEADNAPIGDPLEIVTMASSGFAFDVDAGDGRNSPLATQLTSSEKGIRIDVKQKYHFSSTLKRMSVIANVSRTKESGGSSSSGESNVLVLAKGAPEILCEYLSVVPANYHSTYLYHMSRGKRVLAMAYRPFAGMAGAHLLPRDEVEANLRFVGFLVYDCDLKVDSKSVIRDLKASDHKVVMITGDSVYTAADVARRLGIIGRLSEKKTDSIQYTPAFVLLVNPTAITANERYFWRSLDKLDLGNSKSFTDGDLDFDLEPSAITNMASKFVLSVTGSALRSLEDREDPSISYTEALKMICPSVTIFARVSPNQKESVLIALNDAGLFTLMCGDGTNDVGALKAAHVGVSIVNDPEFEKRLEKINDAGASGKGQKGKSSKDRMARALKELQEQEQDPTIVKLGDASIASPFTARRTSIDSVLTVIRQGRCTLVTTIQVYKILALNCLVSAYMMSALYLRGLKQGDTQMTISGLVIAALFFFLSMAKPLQKISPNKPPSSIFDKSVSLSILGQFIVHFCSLFTTLWICEQYVSDDDFSLTADGKFQPNVVNSSVFLLSLLMQINNFVVNYRGHPFTQSISDNKTLWRSIQVLYAVLLIVAGGQLEPLNDLLEMAKFPSPEFQACLLGILVFNFSAAFLVEHLCKKLE